MSTISNRKVSIVFTEDISSALAFDANSNPASPAQLELLTLASGDNTITLPTGGSTPKSATIIPPSDNTETITLKGVTGDTGILIHKTDPMVLTFDTVPPVSFLLVTSGIITGLRIVWA